MRVHGKLLSYILWVGLVVAVGSGCVPLPGADGTGGYPGHGRHIGKLETSGPYVFVDGRKARYGESIREGMTVHTGEGSSARILYPDGGFSQLDENTDPWFGIRVDAATGHECVYIRIAIGQVFIDKNLHCFETPDVAGVLNSQANVRIERGETDLVLLRGEARMDHPPGIVAASGERAIFSAGRLVAGPHPVSPTELRLISAWRHRFDFTPPMPAEPTRDGAWRPVPIFPRRDPRGRRRAVEEVPQEDPAPVEVTPGESQKPPTRVPMPLRRDLRRLRPAPDQERITPVPLQQDILR